MKTPVHVSQVAWDTWYAGTDREVRGKALCDVGGRSRVGVGLMELPPGSNTMPAHWHSAEEEHLYVLAGRAVLHLGDRTYDLAGGSYVCFPAGQPVPHCLQNTSDAPFLYLMVGERREDDRVHHSPA